MIAKEKIVLNANMSDSDVVNELQNIVNEEIEVRNVKNGLFSTEEAPVLKNSKSFLQKIQDLAIQGTAKIKSEFQTLKTKYNDLLEVLKSKDEEIANLKTKVQALESEAPKQQEKEILETNIFEDLVENAKALKLQNKKEILTEEISEKNKGISRSR